MKQSNRTNNGMITGLMIGVALGVALNNLAIGIALGVALGAGSDSMRKKDATTPNPNDQPDHDLSQESLEEIDIEIDDDELTQTDEFPDDQSL